MYLARLAAVPALLLGACSAAPVSDAAVAQWAAELAGSECFPREFGGYRHLLSRANGDRVFSEIPPLGVRPGAERAFVVSMPVMESIWVQSIQGVLDASELQALAATCNKSAASLNSALTKERFRAIEVLRPPAQLLQSFQYEDGFPQAPVLGKDNRVLPLTEEETTSLASFKADSNLQSILAKLRQEEISRRIRREMNIFNERLHAMRLQQQQQQVPRP